MKLVNWACSLLSFWGENLPARSFQMPVGLCIDLLEALSSCFTLHYSISCHHLHNTFSLESNLSFRNMLLITSTPYLDSLRQPHTPNWPTPTKSFLIISDMIHRLCWIYLQEHCLAHRMCLFLLQRKAKPKTNKQKTIINLKSEEVK